MSAGVDPVKWDQALADIRVGIPDPEDREQAIRQLHSLRDYSPKDESTCTWEMALDNCEQIKGYFPANTPAAALQNIDEMRKDIVRLEKSSTSLVARILTNPIFVALVVGAVVVFAAISLWQQSPR